MDSCKLKKGNVTATCYNQKIYSRYHKQLKCGWQGCYLIKVLDRYRLDQKRVRLLKSIAEIY